MITTEQNQEIINYLLKKNLPCDLMLEVRDHMAEQIENSEEQGFDEAFQSAKKSWKSELEMVFTFQINNLFKMTRFQKRIERKTYWQILGKCLSIYLPFIVVMCLLAVKNPEIFKNIMQIIYYICLLGSLFLFFRYFTILKSTFTATTNKMSLFQKGSGNVIGGGLMIGVYNVWLDSRFDEYILDIRKMINLDFSGSVVAHFFIVFGPTLWFLFGLMYFIPYKKAVSIVNERIDFI